MSKCTSCLQNMCRKHPLQDHGEREKKIKSLAKASSNSFLKRSYQELIKGQIDKMEAAANVGSKEESDSYKNSMGEEREKAEKRGKRRFASDEHEEFSRRSGLNPAVLATMLAGSDSDSDDDDKVASNRGGNDNAHYEEQMQSKKGKKKDKKEKKEKKEKKSSSKKEKKSCKRKGKSRSHSSSSESDLKQMEPIPQASIENAVDSMEASSSSNSSYYGLV